MVAWARTTRWDYPPSGEFGMSTLARPGGSRRSPRLGSVHLWDHIVYPEPDWPVASPSSAGGDPPPQLHVGGSSSSVAPPRRQVQDVAQDTAAVGYPPTHSPTARLTVLGHHRLHGPRVHRNAARPPICVPAVVPSTNASPRLIALWPKSPTPASRSGSAGDGQQARAYVSVPLRRSDAHLRRRSAPAMVSIEDFTSRLSPSSDITTPGEPDRYRPGGQRRPHRHRPGRWPVRPAGRPGGSRRSRGGSWTPAPPASRIEDGRRLSVTCVTTIPRAEDRRLRHRTFSPPTTKPDTPLLVPISA